MKIKRRDFLKLIGGVSGALAFGGFGLNQIIEVPDKLIEMAKKGLGIETWKNTICGQCPGGCGIQVRLIDGIPVYIKGNPLYPVNQGGMCPMGHSALELLFNPDRVKGPVKRIGLHGSGQWESVSWDYAIKMVVNELTALRNEEKSHQVAFLGSNEHGMMKEHISRFMQAYGSPNYYQFSSSQNDSVPLMLTQGKSQIPAYDFLKTKYILSFGSNFLEGGYSPVYYTKLYSSLRELEKEKRALFVQIESRMSLTAVNADRWIPIRPGTYGALALGIAYVLLREELYDQSFIRDHTFGFEDWKDRSGMKHLGFKSLVIGNYYPERVSEITGVPSNTILEIGRELGNTLPALVLGGQGTTDNTNGTFSQMAVHSLNALLGNFGQEGGLFFIDDPPFIQLPAIEKDTIAIKGIQQELIAQPRDTTYPLTNFSVTSFIKNILADQPYPISILFLYKGNPLFQSLNHHDFSAALRKIPLVVSFDSFVNETSEFANLILPDHTFLEKWDENSNVPSVGFSHVGVQQPIVEPFHNTRNAGDVVIEFAKQIGGTVALSFPFESYKQELLYKVESIYKSGKGAVVSEGLKSSWLDYLQQRGWHTGRYDSFNEFWELLLRNGGWWNPIREKKNLSEIFETPSGKFEFYSQKLKETIDDLVEKTGNKDSPTNLELILNSLNIKARGDTVFLPHYEPSPDNTADEPMYFTTFQCLTNRDGDSSNQPMMQEMFGYTMRHYWESWAEINPQTAADNGISEGDWIWIESAIGSIKVKSKINPGILPDLVSVPFGLGHTSYGRYAKGHGINPNTIIKNYNDLISGKPALQATRVKISAAT